MSGGSTGSGSKKPSGSFNRKRKLQHANEDEKQSRALQKFFSASTSTTKLDEDVTTITEIEKHDLPILEAVTGPSTSQSQQINETVS